MPALLSIRKPMDGAKQIPGRCAVGLGGNPYRRFAGDCGVLLVWGLLALASSLMPAAGQFPPADQNPRPATVGGSSNTQEDNVRPLLDNQRKILKARLEKTRSDAAEMADLAKKLREKLDKPNPDAFSPDVVALAERIGKLARRIREETEGF